MKLPVRLADRRVSLGDLQIVDARNITVATVLKCAEDRKIADMIVTRLNRWRWLKNTVEYTRDDWLMEHNKWRPS